MKTDSEQIGQGLHLAALELIAQRNQKIGKAASDYDQDEYVAALGEVYEERHGVDDDVAAALAEIHGASDTTVTADLLRARQQELLREDGFPVSGSGRVLAPDSDRVAAMREAIGELGEPGRERVDLVGHADRRRDALIAAGVKAGKITDRLQAHVRRLYDNDPQATETLLAAWGVAVDEAGEPTAVSVYANPGLRKAALALTQVEGETLVSPDEESLTLHVRAEELIVRKGWGSRKPITGELVYDGDTYMRALQAIEQGDRRAAEEAAEQEPAAA
jgi:hypothetical protein